MEIFDLLAKYQPPRPEEELAVARDQIARLVGRHLCFQYQVRAAFTEQLDAGAISREAVNQALTGLGLPAVDEDGRG